MIYKLIVPGAVEEVEEIRVLEWHRQEGQAVAAGELIVELETDKAVVEVRVAQPVVLRRIVRQAGEWQAVGSPLAFFSDAAGEDVPADAAESCEPLEVEFEVS